MTNKVNFSFMDWARIKTLRLLFLLYRKIASRPLLYTLGEKVNPYYAKFPDPPTTDVKNKVHVNAIGRKYYAGTYPRWIMWNYEEPTTLYVNVDMLVQAYRYYIKDEVDGVVLSIIKLLAKAYAAKLLPENSLSTEANTSNVRLWYTTDKNKERPVVLENWLGKEMIKKIEDI